MSMATWKERNTRNRLKILLVLFVFGSSFDLSRSQSAFFVSAPLLTHCLAGLVGWSEGAIARWWYVCVTRLLKCPMSGVVYIRIIFQAPQRIKRECPMRYQREFSRCGFFVFVFLGVAIIIFLSMKCFRYCWLSLVFLLCSVAWYFSITCVFFYSLVFLSVQLFNFIHLAAGVLLKMMFIIVIQISSRFLLFFLIQIAMNLKSLFEIRKQNNHK